MAKLSSVRIIRPAFLATWVPVPIAMPMSAALIAGASLTPSPVMATTSPFLRRVSTISTLCSGATRPTTPMPSMRARRSCLGHRREVGAEDGLSGDAELLGDRRAGDHVVSGDHPHADVGVLGGPDRVQRLGAGRIDHPDQRRHLQVLDQRQQVALGVEVPGSRSFMAAAMMRRPLPPSRSISSLARSFCSSPQGTLSPLARADVARPITAGAAPLTKTRTTGLPDSSLAFAEGGHELVRGIERQRREPGVRLLGAFDVQLRLVPEDQQRALGGVAHDLAVDELGVVGDEERQDRGLDGVRVAGGVLDLAVEPVAHAGDRVPVRGVDHLDDRDLVHRQRAGLVRVDRRRRAQGLHRVEALHHGAVRGEVSDPLDRMTCSTVGMAIGTAARASAMAVVKMVWAE